MAKVTIPTRAKASKPAAPAAPPAAEDKPSAMAVSPSELPDDFDEGNGETEAGADDAQAAAEQAAAPAAKPKKEKKPRKKRGPSTDTPVVAMRKKIEYQAQVLQGLGEQLASCWDHPQAQPVSIGLLSAAESARNAAGGMSEFPEDFEPSSPVPQEIKIGSKVQIVKRFHGKFKKFFPNVEDVVLEVVSVQGRDMGCETLGENKRIAFIPKGQLKVIS